jgi:hypothetical protein
MSVINTGKTFANGEQLTADKLNQVIDQAEFNASEAVDGSTITLISGAMAVNDNGITEAKIDNGAVTKNKLATDALELAYPVGSIYMNASNSDNPSTLLGFGTWVAFGAGRVLIGEGSDSDDQPTPETVSFTAGDEGGEYNHTLDLDEMPSHRHGGIYPAGSAGSFTQGFDVDDATSGNTLAEEKFTTYAGGDKTDGTEGTTQAHNNLQPYIVVYMWKRTA